MRVLLYLFLGEEQMFSLKVRLEKCIGYKVSLPFLSRPHGFTEL